MQAGMSVAARTENQYWAEKGKGIIAKDNLKNVRMGDIRNASTVENAYSDFLSTNVTTRLSEMPSLKDFNETEESANEIIKKAQSLFNKDALSDFTSEFSGSKLEKEVKAWNNFANIEEIRFSDSAETLDKSLAVLERATKKG